MQALGDEKIVTFFSFSLGEISQNKALEFSKNKLFLQNKKLKALNSP